MDGFFELHTYQFIHSYVSIEKTCVELLSIAEKRKLVSFFFPNDEDEGSIGPASKVGWMDSLSSAVWPNPHPTRGIYFTTQDPNYHLPRPP